MSGGFAWPSGSVVPAKEQSVHKCTRHSEGYVNDITALAPEQ